MAELFFIFYAKFVTKSYLFELARREEDTQSLPLFHGILAKADRPQSHHPSIARPPMTFVIVGREFGVQLLKINLKHVCAQDGGQLSPSFPTILSVSMRRHSHAYHRMLITDRGSPDGVR
jgi:hypothetical protein